MCCYSFISQNILKILGTIPIAVTLSISIIIYEKYIKHRILKCLNNNNFPQKIILVF